MEGNNVDAELNEQLRKLQAKYDAMGQDLSSYLDGLLYSDFLTYWDYIHLDTLLSLQSPKTQFPDEKVFIMYHQITELYFQLILHELKQITEKENPEEKFFIDRLDRVVRYFRHLEDSFDIMVKGMERDQFLKFRMALLPASGFQSAQYRLIEIYSTDMINLVNANERATVQTDDIARLLEKLYWRSGATELASGKKTLTLQQFEQKYMRDFYDTGVKLKDRNLRKIFTKYFMASPRREEIVSKLRELDTLSNVLWPLAHLKSAGHYLHKDPEDIKATGGTNWQKYLPPRFKRIIFFPELWTEKEKEEWGKAAFVHETDY
ncbi:tryptophan 2,3-dioxygenase family protein [Ohtaekwangia koreensis]|uniref:Tryptophan 2,3-dioxygenase n=1 Tax=Ohtaekwangia koreensis TaxID=688867 RepID=A0A1T5K4X2_9BACT|nr:tryptophan 2,3-dioxygenase family protein [Ohtaekwangia koreensis]SKC58585.1 tryptophan 2,3-dioxygenase [Ohtaekwangia koreensis]